MHETPSPRDIVCKGCFSNSTRISGVNFTNNISIPHITWQNLCPILTINLKNEFFHNSIECSMGFIFKWISHHSPEKFSDLHYSVYWKMYFVPPYTLGCHHEKGVRMKNSNITEVHWKTRFLGEWGHEKLIYRDEVD